jgi:hypothetical protein
LTYVDDTYNKLKKSIGNDFTKDKQAVTELYSFRCSNCGYKNILDATELNCGCGTKLQGILVYRKVQDTVVYDNREKKKRK